MIQGEKWEVNIRENFVQYDNDVFIYRFVGEGKVNVLQVKKGGVLEVVECDRFGSNPPAPTLRLTREMQQALFDALQRNGMKPTDQSFVEGKLAATQEHLKDMRELVFNPDIFYGHDREVINVGVPTPKESL